jgi:hypothetical protein
MKDYLFLFVPPTMFLIACLTLPRLKDRRILFLAVCQGNRAIDA